MQIIKRTLKRLEQTVFSALTEEGKRMLQIPQNCIHTCSTPFWNEQTTPAGIFERHPDKGTRPEVCSHLSVMHGTVKYFGYPDEHNTGSDQVILIEVGQFVVFPPEK